jgi:DNA-binding LacI/PurR family transcriptional regulator
MANQFGIKVPEDLGIVGYDDMRLAKDFCPPLTTVRQDFQEFGSRAVEKLLSLIKGSDDQICSAVQPELVVRESSMRGRGGKAD